MYHRCHDILTDEVIGNDGDMTRYNTLLACVLLLFPLQVKKAGGLKATMFHAAYAYKQFWMKLGFNSNWASPVANRVVFKNTQVRSLALQ